jgi:hypothetical protein
VKIEVQCGNLCAQTIMGNVHTAPRTVLVLVFFALFPASCATDLSIEKRDGWPDVTPDSPDEPDAVDSVDVPVEDGPLPDCGNGEVDDGEECDGDPPRECTTSCDSTGIQTCVDCLWSECVPPCESCNDGDDDCDDAVDESGRFTTATPVRITDDAASSTRVELSWNETEAGFGLVWVDERDGQQDLRSAIVPADVSAWTDDAFLAADTGILAPAMTWMASDEYGIVATDETGGAGRHVFCQRMGPDGTPLGALRVLGSTDGVDLHAPVIIGRTGGYAVFWDTAFGVHLALTNTQCNLAGSVVDLVTDPDVSRDVRVATNGTVYGLVWVDERDGNPEIYGGIVDGTDLVHEIRLTEDAADSVQPDVVWDGSTFVATWSDGRTGTANLFLTRFNPPGAVLDVEVQITDADADATSPSVGWTGSALGVAWEQGGGIYLQVFEGAGHPLLCAREISGGGDSRGPDLVVTDTGFGVAWNDDRAGNQEIYLVSVDHEDCP